MSCKTKENMPKQITNKNKVILDVAKIDIKENNILKIDENLLNILLKDRATDKNIIWATTNYQERGIGYGETDHITLKNITGENGNIIKPRIEKNKTIQIARIKENAEVFTPSWLCNHQNNLVDNAWFEYKDIFNRETSQSWKTIKHKISFENGKTWQDYVLQKRMEITCGEAPYLVSRYDTTTGDFISIQNRIGMLDRKLRVINENAKSEQEWVKWAKIAYQNIYAYEYQGDSLLLARENLLLTFADYYYYKFAVAPIVEYLLDIAEIISWNIWQMDGLNGNVPFAFIEQFDSQQDLFQEIKSKNPIQSKIMDWAKNKEIEYKDIKGDENMKFDVIIGNPPYQNTIAKTKNQTQGNSSYIYHLFQFEADKISNISCLIYPFGGWFDAPKRLNGLGETILTDKHTISINAYEGTTDKRAWCRIDKNPQPLFGTNANLSAGVAIVLRDRNLQNTFLYSNRIYSDISVAIDCNNKLQLTPNPIFISINKKLETERLNNSIKKGIFGIESDWVEKNPNKVSFSKSDWENPIQVLTNDKSGSSGRAKLYWTDKKYIPKGKEYINCYKVIMTSAYPKKTLVSGVSTLENVQRRVLELIELLPANTAFGRSRLSLFMSKSKTECENFIKYTKTKFFAGLVLQEPNRSSSFGDIIPLQNFTNNSDIDWSKSVDEIDKQLYKKYNLNKEEISFIENHIKEME